MALNASPEATPTAAGRNSAGRVRPTSLAELPFADRIRFLLFGRALPALFFAAIAYNQYRNLTAHVGQFRTDTTLYNASLLPHDALYLLFCAIPVGLYLTRAIPRAADGSLPARAAAFLGTTILLIIGAFVRGGPQLWSSQALAVWVGAPILIAAFGFAVVAMLYLRRNLSIMPEVRGLVTGGPYSVVRHPLYLAEISAALGFIVGSAALQQIIGFAALIALQLTRTHYEERLLSQTIPGYAAYADRTRKIIPGVW